MHAPPRLVALSLLSLTLAAGCASGEEEDAESNSSALTQGDRLFRGERLNGVTNDSITSANGAIRLQMNANCNMDMFEIMYRRGLFSSRTLNRGENCFAIFQDDGNFVIYSAPAGGALKPLWASNSHRKGGTHLVLQNDGDLVIFAGDRPIWRTNTWFATDPPRLTHAASDRLMPGEGFNAPGGDRIVKGRMRLTMQDDCNLVLYVDDDFKSQFEGPALWASGTNGQGKRCYTIMQPDGNLVVYSHPEGYRRPQAVWSSGTHGNPGAHLVVQDDGNLVIYQGTRALWATGTTGPHARPECRFDRPVSECKKFVLMCKKVYKCLDKNSYREHEESSDSHVCGACVGGVF